MSKRKSDFAWDVARWSAHVISVVFGLYALMSLLSLDIVDVAGWGLLAYGANRAAVNMFAIRAWVLSSPQRRANLAAARRTMRANRRLVRSAR